MLQLRQSEEDKKMKANKRGLLRVLKRWCKLKGTQ